MKRASSEENLDSLRGLEGVGSSAYFSVFDSMILRDKENFFFTEETDGLPWIM